MLKEFKAFILRGNAIDLAVGVVMGAAFGTVVNSLVVNILTPLTTIWNKCEIEDNPLTPNVIETCDQFENLTFTIGESTFRYGSVINSIITLLLVGAAVFFLVVRPLNRLEERRKGPTEEVPGLRACPECLSEIPRQARRCAHCTAEIAAAP